MSYIAKSENYEWKTSGIKKNLSSFEVKEKIKMIDKDNKNMSIREQCNYIGLNRSTLYYEQRPVSAETLKIMNKIDEIYTDFPVYGTRRMGKELNKQGIIIGRDRVRTLMNLMGLEAIYPKKKLSTNSPNHKKYPYLLDNVMVERKNQVWSTDITYIRMRKGFLYLVAIIDWYSRYVLSWRLSNSLDASFCIEALEEALKKACPEIFNTDQVSQFTSDDFTSILQKYNIKISMDGRGRMYDNIFSERLWRTVKYEEVYLKDYGIYEEAYEGLNTFFCKYNNRRLHQSLDYKTPYEVYNAK
ncbi:transposase IS3/IS911 family protein [Candidatus Omnitrophus magneticus]|uniref:Transposase IS3/IS911 family protein n=1 Tax=Candidatus Omnitrophus magneticus TaxID=1609969 RepID=A0A0F0CTJ7_9BACT|nr:transposase IS3/IS911 family protein [Candidatus Omnitrophus magneticus]